MGLIDRIKKDKPDLIEFICGDKTESMKVPRGRGRWTKVRNAADSLDWDKVATRKEDGTLINMHDPDTDPAVDDPDEPNLAVNQVEMDPESEVCQIVRAVTAAQEAIIAPVLRAMTDMHQLTIGNIQAQYTLAMDRMEYFEQKLQESQEKNLELHEKAVKGEKPDNGLNTQMAQFVMKALPGLARGMFRQPSGQLGAGEPSSDASGEPDLPPEGPPDMGDSGETE